MPVPGEGFEVGSRVRCINSVVAGAHPERLVTGRIYTITELINDRVKLQGDTYWYYPRRFILTEEQELPETDFYLFVYKYQGNVHKRFETNKAAARRLKEGLLEHQEVTDLICKKIRIKLTDAYID